MTKKRSTIVITTILSIIVLCIAALLLCYHKETSGSTSNEGLPSNFSYVYSEKLDLSIPVCNDWNIIGMGIAEEKTNYQAFGFSNYQQMLETAEENKYYLVGNQTDDECFTLFVSALSDKSPQDIGSITDGDLPELCNTLAEFETENILRESDYFKEEDLKKFSKTCNLTTINNNKWIYFEFHDPDNVFTVSDYIGNINNNVIIIHMNYLKDSPNACIDVVMNHLTPGSQVATSVDTNKSLLEKAYDTIHMENIPLWIFGAVLLIILLYGAKIAKPKQFFDDCLSLKVCKGIQGFAALGIILHHLVQKTTNADLTGIRYFNNLGVLFVGIFFFFSGYGLFVSYHTKENYLHRFLVKRLPILLLPFFLSSWIYVIARCIAGESMGISRLLKLITTINLPNENSWYVIELLILYLIFYFTFKYIKNKNIAYAINGIGCVVIIIVSLLMGHCKTGEIWFKGEWWYNTILLFFIGMTYAKFRNKLLPTIKKLYWVLLPAFMAAFAVLYHFTIKQLNNGGYWTETATSMAYGDKFKTLSLQLPMIICFIIALLLLTMKLQFGNRFIRFIGTFTLELYLVQNLFIGYMKQMGSFRNNALFMLAVFVLSIITAWALHRLCRSIMNIFTKKDKNEPAKQVSTVSRNKFIDTLRLVMCFLVVCIHIPFPGELGTVVITYGKTAVPFFIAVCGYLCYREDSVAFGDRLKKQGARLLSLAVWANLLYALIFYLRNGSDKFAACLTDSSLYNLLFLNEAPFASHLWFLGSLIFAIGIMMLLNRLKVANKVIYVFPVLLGIYFLCWRLDGNMKHMIQYRNAISCTLSYFMAGCVLRKHEQWLKAHIKPTAIIVVTSLLFASTGIEYILCKTADIPYYTTELLTFALLVLCIVCYKNKAESQTQPATSTTEHSFSLHALGRTCSLNIYIFHIAFIIILQSILGDKNVLLTKLGPITIFLVTLIFAYLLYVAKKCYNSLIKK